jgi:hypothetical protein
MAVRVLPRRQRVLRHRNFNRNGANDMTDSTTQTLMSIQRLLEAGQTTPRQALVAAFSLGRLEGLAEMAALGQEKMKDLMEKAA